MKEIFFFRNIENYDELVNKDKMKRRISNNSQEYKIIDIILINEDEYKQFLKCFNRNWSFLHKYIDEMKIRNNIWQCILIKSKEEDGILIMSDGYQYPRFTALFFDENIINKM